MIRRETLRRLPLVVPVAAFLLLCVAALALGYWGLRIVGPIVGPIVGTVLIGLCVLLVGLGGLGAQALVSIIEWSRREPKQEEAEQLKAEILTRWKQLPPEDQADLLKKMLE